MSENNRMIQHLRIETAPSVLGHSIFTFKHIFDFEELYEIDSRNAVEYESLN